MERDGGELSQSSLYTSVDIKTEEAESQCSDSAAQCHPPIEDIGDVSVPFNDNSVTTDGIAQSHESELVDMEKSIKKTGYGTEQAALKSQSSIDTPNDVKNEEADSTHSDFVASETHLIKEEKKHVCGPFSEISGTTQSKDHYSELANRENHMVMEKTSTENAECQKREHGASEDIPGIDGMKHTMEQNRGSLEMNESKM